MLVPRHELLSGVNDPSTQQTPLSSDDNRLIILQLRRTISRESKGQLQQSQWSRPADRRYLRELLQRVTTNLDVQDTL